MIKISFNGLLSILSVMSVYLTDESYDFSE